MFEPHLYAVFGYPIHHSKSPQVHCAFAEQTEQDLMYTKQEVQPDDFQQVCKEFFDFGGQGLNITLPLKELAFNYATKLTDRAKLAGAVNTLKQFEDGTILGDNTDGAGMVRDITANLKWQIENKRVLILGAGGAVRGVLGPLFDERPESIWIANRTAEKAVTLAEAFELYGEVHGCGLDNIPHLPFDLIINGTSMSLQGQVPDIPSDCITPYTCAYDMAYAAKPTPFLEWAEKAGIRHYADGLGMLVEQAAESFFLWRDVRPNTQTVIASLREAMANQL